MKVLVTGGAGFVGSNLARQLVREGYDVRIIDNLARAGSEHNLAWLQSEIPQLDFIRGDLRDMAAVTRAVTGCDAIFNLAAQVAVTTSVTDPRLDFEVNLLGTFNVLEAVRAAGRKIPVLFSSTNKVYGKMSAVPICERNGRYEYEAMRDGVSEETPLDFYSPYGCSKGGADQYIHDYGRIFGIPTVVFRMSCIYGIRQMGNEDQGWVAHFLIQAAKGNPVTIYGDGKQSRDVLWVGDLVSLYIASLRAIDTVDGQIFNVGGGPANTICLHDLIAIIREDFGVTLEVSYGDWRPGDQLVYVSDIAKAKRILGWEPRTDVRRGLGLLYDWIQGNLGLFA
ncbi:SDR family NAD(P)-dependent oxidoreductase [bacterium]|nr:SDR family NAD(P)-dependent oxidoreductase [candidate division CSSED10-310 bacterium]